MNGDEPPDFPVSPLASSRLFSLADEMRQVTEVLEGEVASLMRNGWTDSQARAIVATLFGWRAPSGEESGA